MGRRSRACVLLLAASASTSALALRPDSARAQSAGDTRGATAATDASLPMETQVARGPACEARPRAVRVERYLGGVLPPCARLERRRNDTLLAVGGVLFAIGYLPTAVYGGAGLASECADCAVLLAPVVGTVLWPAAFSGSFGVSFAGTLAGFATALTLLQAGGVLLMALGVHGDRVLVTPATSTSRARDASPWRWSLGPTAHGAMLRVDF